MGDLLLVPDERGAGGPERRPALADPRQHLILPEHVVVGVHQPGERRHGTVLDGDGGANSHVLGVVADERSVVVEDGGREVARERRRGDQRADARGLGLQAVGVVVRQVRGDLRDRDRERVDLQHVGQGVRDDAESRRDADADPGQLTQVGTLPAALLDVLLADRLERADVLDRSSIEEETSGYATSGLGSMKSRIIATRSW